MKKIMRYVGMDVHAETIAIAVVEENGTERGVGVIANRPEAIRKCLKKLGRPEELHCCYEAGPTGYVLYWQLVRMGIPAPGQSSSHHGWQTEYPVVSQRG